jgi:hypothetical protein
VESFRVEQAGHLFYRYLEFNESGQFLFVCSERDYGAQIDDMFRLMTTRRIRCGCLFDLVRKSLIDDQIAICRYLEAVLLIPAISSEMQDTITGEVFTFVLIASGLPFFAFDRPELTQFSLVDEVRRTGKPMNAQLLDIAVKEQKRRAKSMKIRQALAEAKARGVKLGNPRITEAQTKARAAIQAAKPSRETLNLMSRLRQEGKTLREIALVLNERGIKPPRGKQWYASSVRNQLT